MRSKNILGAILANCPVIKANSQGNDFLIFNLLSHANNIASIVESISQQAILLCDRKFGLGCDQIVVLSPHPTHNANIAFLNSDGTLSAACGNGTRCAAGYLLELNPTQHKIIFQAGERQIVCKSSTAVDDFVEVEMGAVKAINNKQDVDFVHQICRQNNLPVVDVFLGDIGNPHCVIHIEQDVENLFAFEPEKITKIGKIIENATEHFPAKINVEFCNILPNGDVFFIVWERGAGITLSCGTGACVVGFYAMQKNAKNAVKVITQGAKIEAKYNNLPPQKIGFHITRSRPNLITMHARYTLVAQIGAV